MITYFCGFALLTSITAACVAAAATVTITREERRYLRDELRRGVVHHLLSVAFCRLHATIQFAVRKRWLKPFFIIPDCYKVVFWDAIYCTADKTEQVFTEFTDVRNVNWLLNTWTEDSDGLKKQRENEVHLLSLIRIFASVYRCCRLSHLKESFLSFFETSGCFFYTQGFLFCFFCISYLPPNLYPPTIKDIESWLFCSETGQIQRKFHIHTPVASVVH